MTQVVCDKADECRVFCRLAGVDICGSGHYEPHEYYQNCDGACTWRHEMGGNCVPVGKVDGNVNL